MITVPEDLKNWDHGPTYTVGPCWDRAKESGAKDRIMIGGDWGGGGGGRQMQINTCPFRMYRIRRPCNGRALWIFARN